MRRLTAPVGAALAGQRPASAAVHAARPDCPPGVPIPLTLAAAWQRVEPCNREVHVNPRGATGMLDLLEAHRSLKTVEQDEVQARAEAAKAWARREAANETAQEDLT
jgi:hypothetical protein